MLMGVDSNGHFFAGTEGTDVVVSAAQIPHSELSIPHSRSSRYAAAINPANAERRIQH
jgi:hypothetical protein